MHAGCALACGTCKKKKKDRVLQSASANAAASAVDDPVLEQSSAFGEKQKAEGVQAADTIEVVRAAIE